MESKAFDFIIVGGGLVGLVLAARLSEDPSAQVLVIEAGEDLTADPRVKIPALSSTLVGTSADWCLQTTPQVRLLFHCYSLLPITNELYLERNRSTAVNSHSLQDARLGDLVLSILIPSRQRRGPTLTHGQDSGIRAGTGRASPSPSSLHTP